MCSSQRCIKAPEYKSFLHSSELNTSGKSRRQDFTWSFLPPLCIIVNLCFLLILSTRHECLPDSCDCFSFFSPNTLPAHLVANHSELGTSEHEEIKSSLKKCGIYDTRRHSGLFYLLKYCPTKTGNSASCVHSTQPSSGLVTCLAHYVASNSEIIILPRCHLICIWHISGFHLH